MGSAARTNPSCHSLGASLRPRSSRPPCRRTRPGAAAGEPWALRGHALSLLHGSLPGPELGTGRVSGRLQAGTRVRWPGQAPPPRPALSPPCAPGSRSPARRLRLLLRRRRRRRERPWRQAAGPAREPRAGAAPAQVRAAPPSVPHAPYPPPPALLPPDPQVLRVLSRLPPPWPPPETALHPWTWAVPSLAVTPQALPTSSLQLVRGGGGGPGGSRVCTLPIHKSS